MNPIVLTRWISDTVAEDPRPLSDGLVRVVRGAQVTLDHGPSAAGYRDAPGAHELVPVIVRMMNPYTKDPEVLAIFQRVAAARLALGGKATPRLMQTLGQNVQVLATVEEMIVGAPLSSLLARLRSSGQSMPEAVALEITRALISLWSSLVDAPIPSRFSLDPYRVRLEHSGRVRVLPIFEEERSRQSVGAALLHFDDVVAYCAPEQIAGRPADERSHMFVLGLMLYEMLAGHHPLRGQGQSVFEVMTGLASNALPSLRDRRRGLHPALIQLVHRCLAPLPSDRFASWHELGAALSGLQALYEPVGLAGTAAYVRSILGAFPVDPPIQWASLVDSSPRLSVVSLPPAVATTRRDSPAVVLDRDAIYAGNDARPMFALSPSLLVDARPVTKAEIERFLFATRASVPPYLSSIGESEDEPCVHVPIETAEEYARWAGKRLPTEAEWVMAATKLGAEKLGAGLVWEWTATASSSGGRIVRGGRWRDQPGSLPSPEHRSFARTSAPDLGFRCVMEVEGDRPFPPE